MAQPLRISRLFLLVLIASLSISALIAIFVFLFGNFGETELKLLLTTLIIGGYSLPGLCSSTLYDRGKYLPLAFAGLIVSILGFFLTVGALWEIVDLSDSFSKLIPICAILAFSIAHTSLMLLSRSDKQLVTIARNTTIFFIIIVAVMLIHLVLGDDLNPFEFYYRLLGVFAVLDVLGTITTPVLKKITA